MRNLEPMSGKIQSAMILVVFHSRWYYNTTHHVAISSVSNSMIYPVDDMIQTPMLQTHNAKHRKKGRSLNSTCNAGRQNAKPH